MQKIVGVLLSCSLTLFVPEVRKFAFRLPAQEYPDISKLSKNDLEKKTPVHTQGNERKSEKEPDHLSNDTTVRGVPEYPTQLDRAPSTSGGSRILNSLDCSREEAYRSPLGIPSAATVTFSNSTPETVRVHWLDAEGKRIFYASLASGQSYIQQT